MAKATVQAALGPVALKHLSDTDPDRKYAEIVLMVCILSIVLTAPTGAILISITGKKLLTRTTQPQNLEGKNTQRPIYGVIIKFYRCHYEWRSECLLRYSLMTLTCLLLFYLSFTGWRRSHRPSLRDISIIDEEEERDLRDPEMGPDRNTLQNTQSNASLAPAFTITK